MKSGSEDNEGPHKSMKLKYKIFTQFFGEFELGSNFLNKRSNHSAWIIIKIIDAILRGIGQVCFANNPISGLFCIAALYLGSPYVALASVVASLSAIISSVVFDQPFTNVTNGLNQFNSVLIGTVLTSLYPALYSGSDKDTFLWILIVIGSMLSVPLQNGIGNLLASLTSKTTSATPHGSFQEKKLGMVAFTFPFNIIGQISFVLLALRTQPSQHLEEPQLQIGAHNATDIAIDWTRVIEGSILSMGQVYAVNTLIGSVLMIVGFLLCSPILSFSMVFGGALGTFTALAMLGNNEDRLEDIYSGIYGYNSVLTGGALGGFFMVLTWRSSIRCVCGIFLTVALHIVIGAAYAGYSSVNVPICTLPFVVACWMLHLNTSNNLSSMPRVALPSVPEIHLVHHLKALKAEEDS